MTVIYILMIDKGKYASHGAFIKRLPAVAVAQHHKPKLGKAIITQLSSILCLQMRLEYLPKTISFKEWSCNQRHILQSISF